jgi:hypothetical protein
MLEQLTNLIASGEGETPVCWHLYEDGFPEKHQSMQVLVQL